MNYCRKCESDYEKPGTCNCFAETQPAKLLPWQPYTPPPTYPWYTPAWYQHPWYYTPTITQPGTSSPTFTITTTAMPASTAFTSGYAQVAE